MMGSRSQTATSSASGICWICDTWFSAALPQPTSEILSDKVVLLVGRPREPEDRNNSQADPHLQRRSLRVRDLGRSRKRLCLCRELWRSYPVLRPLNVARCEDSL